MQCELRQHVGAVERTAVGGAPADVAGDGLVEDVLRQCGVGEVAALRCMQHTRSREAVYEPLIFLLQPPRVHLHRPPPWPTEPPAALPRVITLGGVPSDRRCSVWRMRAVTGRVRQNPATNRIPSFQRLAGCNGYPTQYMTPHWQRAPGACKQDETAARCGGWRTCFVRWMAVWREVRLREAAERVASRRLMESASMHTLSMLCASSKTTTHSFSSSRDTCTAGLSHHAPLVPTDNGQGKETSAA